MQSLVTQLHVTSLQFLFFSNPLFFLLFFFYYLFFYFANILITDLLPAYLLTLLLAVFSSFVSAIRSQIFPNFFYKLDVLFSIFHNLYRNIGQIALLSHITNILLTLPLLFTSRELLLQYVQSSISQTGICKIFLPYLKLDESVV